MVLNIPLRAGRTPVKDEGDFDGECNDSVRLSGVRRGAHDCDEPAGREGSCPKCNNITVIPGSAAEGHVLLCPRVDQDFAPPVYEPAIASPSQPSRPALGFRCPYCQSNLPPEVTNISTGGWITFVLLLFFCFPLCFIGLFIKEDYRVCRSCRITLG